MATTLARFNKEKITAHQLLSSPSSRCRQPPLSFWWYFADSHGQPCLWLESHSPRILQHLMVAQNTVVGLSRRELRLPRRGS
uniref:Uncharacterized protein n=1 Tax=Cannabis sativa TaxID=3483 RepID=A0A803PCI0_CANSA